MTTLMERMREELVRRNYAATTIHSYLKAVKHFRSHVDRPIDEVGPDDLRSYHAFLLGTRKLAVNTVVLNICALRFLYIKVLKRRDMKEDLPYPKQRLRLPVILSPDEVARLIGAARNLYHRTLRAWQQAEEDEPGSDGVSPPLYTAHSAAGLRSNPAIRIPHQHAAIDSTDPRPTPSRHHAETARSLSKGHYQEFHLAVP